MVGVNKVILIGNLGRDPEVVSFDSVKKATFSLATTEVHKAKDGSKVEETEWHNIVCWRGLAEIAERFLKKGMQIYQILHLISAPIFLTKHLFRIKREMPLYQYGYISRLLLMY